MLNVFQKIKSESLWNHVKHDGSQIMQLNFLLVHIQLWFNVKKDSLMIIAIITQWKIRSSFIYF